MVKIKIKDVEYDMPSKWSEVNYPMYIKLAKVFELQDEPLNRVVNLISILSGVYVKILRTVAYNGLSQINLSWLSEPLDSTLERTIRIAEQDYMLIDNLQSLSLGEYADLEHYGKEPNNIHYVIAIILRPVVDGKIEDYDDQTLKERAELFLEKLNIEQVTALSSFFLGIVKGL